MPPSSKPPPLPLAPDRAAVANQISLLLSNRTSLLKTLNPASATQSSPATRRYNVNADDVEQLFSGPRPNEGVGFVPDRKTAATDAASREDRMLRGRLLGKAQRNGKGSAAGRKFAAESESDEEPGRSGLGKRKRPRREPARVDEGGGEGDGEGDGEGEEQGKDDEVEDAETSLNKGNDVAPVEEVVIADHNGGDDAKRNKKKRKRQREKEKQKQKQKLGNAS